MSEPIVQYEVNGIGVIETLPAVYKEFPQLQKYDIPGLAIEKMSQEYLPLKIVDENDKKGYSLVYTALGVARTRRLQIEKKRKELKADSLKFGRVVDKEAMRLTALIEPIEKHLRDEKERIDNIEIERKAEIARKEKELMDKRVAKLIKIGTIFNPVTQVYSLGDLKLTHGRLLAMNEVEFNNYFDGPLQYGYEQEQKRIADEEKKKEKFRIENEKLNAEVDRQKKILRDEKIEKQKLQARLDALEAEADRQEKRDQEKKNLPVEIMPKQTIKEKVANGDKDKIMTYVNDLNAIEKPVITSDKGKLIMLTIQNTIVKIEQYVNKEISNL